MDNKPPSFKASPGEEGKRFTCPDCRVSFAQPWSLRRHDIAIHWHQQFKCPCSCSFTRQDHLHHHQRGCTGRLITRTIVYMKPLSTILGPTQAKTPDDNQQPSTSRLSSTQIQVTIPRDAAPPTTYRHEYFIRKAYTRKVPLWTPPPEA